MHPACADRSSQRDKDGAAVLAPLGDLADDAGGETEKEAGDEAEVRADVDGATGERLPAHNAQIERAATLAEIQERHAAFVETFNTTPHWAHRDRADGLRTPEAVLGWVRGRELDPDVLPRALRQLQLERVVNRAGYVSVQRFYLYAERGLSRQRVSVWLDDGRLHLAYRQALLAQYTYRAERRGKRLRAVDPHPQLYRTAYASPQLELWELDDAQWRKVWERPPRQHHLTRERDAAEARVQQLALPIVGLVVGIVGVALLWNRARLAWIIHGG